MDAVSFGTVHHHLHMRGMIVNAFNTAHDTGHVFAEHVRRYILEQADPSVKLDGSAPRSQSAEGWRVG